MTTLRQATEAFVAVYHARPRLVADLADWSLRIESLPEGNYTVQVGDKKMADFSR